MSDLDNKEFEQAIIDLSAIIAGMVGYIEEQISFTIEGFLENNPHKIARADGHLKAVKKLGNEIIQKTIHTILQFKPKGHYARLIISSWRIASALERISMTMDDITHQTKGVDVKAVRFFFNLIQDIGDLLFKQTFDIVMAYTHENIKDLSNIYQHKNKITDIYQSFFKESFAFCHENPELQSDVIAVLSIGKSLEMTGIYIKDIADQLKIKNISSDK